MKDDQERIPLRTILQNFINHIESLETRRIEDSYEKEFQELKFFSEILKTSKQYCCSDGEKEVNRKKNRYKDILPFDRSRVILEEYAGVPGSDYINANFIKGASGSPAYIASQGPLPHTVNDFWRMVVECEVQVIVMACNQEEAGKHKCENYWVQRENEEKQFGMVSIRLLKASIVCPDFLVRTMMLKYTNSKGFTEERTVCQFHYSAWPDHGVPPLVRPLLDMVRLVRDTQASETLPVLIHCSAGCGRTGTICAIDYVFGLLRAGKLTKDFSMYNLVRDMRRQRIAMVQTKEQYVLVHQAVRELFCEQLRMIDAHPYENIDANGMPLVKEPTYATVNSSTGEDFAEKEDGREKDNSVTSVPIAEAPPLPHKRKAHVASSKQEKEVENLTEKQRSIVEQSSGSESGSISSGMSSLLSRPRISKLKALFERNTTVRESRSSHGRKRGSHQVTRSHSLGPVRHARDETREGREERERQPIQGAGILRVPQLAGVSAATAPPAMHKPALPVKRSKSLKVLGSGERNKLSVAANADSADSSRLDGCDILVKNKSVASSSSSCSIKSHPDSDKKPSVPAKAVPVKDGDLDSSEYGRSGFTRSSREGVLPHQARSREPEDRTPRHTQVDYLTWKNYENMQPILSKRRHSLESVVMDDTSRPGETAHTSEFHIVHLDKDARRLLQDCRDYLGTSRQPIPSGHAVRSRESQQDDQSGNEQFQHLSADAQKKINAIVAGLGVRERRNSFRQAVGTSRDAPARVRDYESIWPGAKSLESEGNAKLDARRGFAVMQPLKVISNPGPSSPPSSEIRTTSNGYLVDPKQSYVIDEKSRYYQKPSDMPKYSNPKYSPKSVMQKTGGSLRIKGPQALAYARAAELEDLGRTPHNIPKPESEKSRAIPWNRHDQPRALESKHSHQEGLPYNESKSVAYHDQSKNAIKIDKVSSPLDQRIFVKRISEDRLPQGTSSSYSDVARNGIDAPNLVKTPVRRTEIPGKSMVPGITFQDQRSSIWPVPNASDAAQARGNPWGSRPTVASAVKPDRAMARPQGSRVGTREMPRQVPSNGTMPQRDMRDYSPRAAESGRQTKLLSPRKADDSRTMPSKPVQDDADPVRYGLVAGVQLRQGSQDDLALCPAAPPRVRRHASVVLMRRSLVETADGPATPLSLWNGSRAEHDWAAGAAGVDLDAVAASIKPRKPVGDQTATLTRALEALHLRKAAQRAEIEQQQMPGFPMQSPSAGKKQQYL